MHVVRYPLHILEAGRLPDDVRSYAERDSPSLVRACGLTGGEPMILPDIVELTEKIKEIDQHITIETAGTMYQKVICDLMSISPKLSNSTPYDREEGKSRGTQHEELRYQPDVLKQLIARIQLSAQVRDFFGGRRSRSARDGQ